MKFRPQRGSLLEAMSEVVEMPATLAALTAHLRTLHKPDTFHPFAERDVRVRAYGYDVRINWHTYIVTISGSAVGFTNSEVPGAE